jgi:manganese/iron transport system substrate-binding protein
MNIFTGKELRQQLGIKILSIGLVGILLACNQTKTEEAAIPPPKPKPTSDKLQVVATSSVLCDLTKIIAGSSIDLKCLIPPDKEPQTYEASITDLNNADILLYNGYGLETGMEKAIKSSTAEKKIAVAEVAVPNPEKKDGKPNPYLWHNAFRALEMAKTIKRNLSESAPKNADLYTKNFDAFDRQMTAMQEWLKRQIASIEPKDRQLVSSRNSLVYYSNSYNIAVEGSAYGNSTADKPTAAQVDRTVARLKKLKIKTVFNEVNTDPQPLAEIAKKAGIKVAKGEIYADGLGKEGSDADTYVKMMQHNTKVILEGLGGKYTAFQPPKEAQEKDKKENKKK